MSSIIVNPNTDPHSYEPTASDGVTLARSRMAIVNGIGYDRWASQLLAANASSSRVVLNVGDLLGLKEGDNPHQWYSPSSVQRVVYFGAGRAAVGTPREVITAATLSGLYGGVPIEVLETSDGRLVVVGLPEAPALHSDRHEHL